MTIVKSCLREPAEGRRDDPQRIQSTKFYSLADNINMSKEYYVYIMTNKNNTVLYVGMTNDLERRVYEHKNKLLSGFTKKYNVTKLVYYENFQNINEAIERENQIKSYKRWKKDRLINRVNIEWKELDDDIW